MAAKTYEFHAAELNASERRHMHRAVHLSGGTHAPRCFLAQLSDDEDLRVFIDHECDRWACSCSVGKGITGEVSRLPSTNELARVLDRFCQGWQVVGIVTLLSGSPFVYLEGQPPAGWSID